MLKDSWTFKTSCRIGMLIGLTMEFGEVLQVHMSDFMEHLGGVKWEEDD